MKLDLTTFVKWKKWCEEIENDLMQLVNYKQIHDYFIEIVNANLDHIKTNEGVLFCDFVRKCYGVQAAVGIRRHVKSDDDSISLIKLLEQIKECAEQFTYDFYLNHYPLDGHEWQRSTFSNFSDNGSIISKQKIKNDIQQLKNLGEKVVTLVDRGIAHLDKRGSPRNVTYKDLDDSLDLFNSIARKYITLLTSVGYVSLQPTIQFDWQKIFTVPLDIRKFES